MPETRTTLTPQQLEKLAQYYGASPINTHQLTATLYETRKAMGFEDPIE